MLDVREFDGRDGDAARLIGVKVEEGLVGVVYACMPLVPRRCVRGC